MATQADPVQPCSSMMQWLRSVGSPSAVTTNSMVFLRTWVKNPHLDHGYAVTSHSSQGQTADRVLIHADTELGAKDLLNNRMAYVAVSRGAYDAQIFTNDLEKLEAALGHDVSHSSSHAPEMKPEQKKEQAVTPQREIAPKQEQGEDFGLSL